MKYESKCGVCTKTYVSKLCDPNLCEDLENAFENPVFDCTWNQFRETIYNTSAQILGLRKQTSEMV